MFKALALATALAVAPITLAHAAPVECVALGALKDELANAQIRVEEYTGVYAKGIILGVVERLGEPPNSDYMLADPILVAFVEDVVFVGFIVQDCYIGRAVLNSDTWTAIIDKVMNHGPRA